MASLERDYYEVLGVSRSAGSEEVKRAFRALARECHPDVSDAPEAEQRFRELAAAYRVLSDPQARLLYDRFGYAGRGVGFFEPLRPPVEPQVLISALDARRGTELTIAAERRVACPECGGEGGSQARFCPACHGSGLVKTASSSEAGSLLRFDDCSACGGSGRTVAELCGACRGSGQTTVLRQVTVRVPPRTQDGRRVEADDGGPVVVRVMPGPPDPRLVRYGAAVGLAIAVALLVFLLFFA